MNEIIRVTEEMTVSARDLHERLGIMTEFRKWFPRMAEYGFEEGQDFKRVSQKCPTLGGCQEMVDYQVSIDMAKQICMIQRSEEGKKIRQYFIDLEKAWNTPEQIMARALKVAENTIESLKLEVKEMKPKAQLADAVTGSPYTISVGEMAKILNQNGVDIGQNRFYKWLRANGYIMGTNTPTQKAMELKIFVLKESTVCLPDGTQKLVKTPRVTGKGQEYFLKKFAVAAV